MATRAERLVGADTFLYLRCGSTSWQPSEANRLKVTAAPGVFELSYDVRQPWMFTTGDDCALVETNMLDGWGSAAVYYRPTNFQLGVPSSDHLVVEPVSAAQMFKVRYPAPGRYRARVDWNEASIAVLPEVPSSPGGVAWSVPGSLVLDAAGNIFRTDTQTPASVSRLDGATGNSLWRYVAGATFSIDGSCFAPDALVLRDGPGLIALAAASGDVLWSSNLSGNIGEGPAHAQCRPDLDAVYVAHGARSEQVTALRWSSGEIAWTVELGAYPSIQAITPAVVVIGDHPAQSETRLTAVDTTTGAVLWTQVEPAWISVQFDATGRLYTSTPRRIRRLDPGTGHPLWSFATQSEFPWLSFEHDGTYLRDIDRFIKLDPEAGQVLWSFPWSGPSYSTATVLLSGDVIFTTTDSATRTTRFTTVNATGAQRWSSALPFGAIVQDKQGRVFIRGTDTLRRLEPRTGLPLWTFVRPLSASAAGASGALGDIQDSDPNSVYVSYSAVGYHYPPMSLAALDVETGRSRWVHDEPGGIRVVGSDAQRVFALIGYFQPIAEALLK